MAEYNRLTSVAELDPLFADSGERPVLFFKHSLTCPISGAAFREYERFLEEQPEGGDTVFTLVEVQNAREVSNAIAERTGVRHESPQALLLRDGEVTWHASHWSIKANELAGAVGG
jgi:bacillithiol system protein YtxJ